MTSVRLSEIFTSIEGEGVLLGTKTMFVRLAGCPLKCHWCDTSYAIPIDSGELVSSEGVKDMITQSLQPNTLKVNFTGGEPLVQYRAVIELAKHVRSLGLKTYLESACYDFARFEKVLPFIDIIKIEFKLRDSKAVEDKNYENLVRNELQCLEAAVAEASGNNKIVFVKIVVTADSKLDEFQELVDRIFSTVPQTGIAGFIIQPSDKIREPSLRRLVEFYDIVFPRCETVRIIPQVHKVLGAR